MLSDGFPYDDGYESHYAEADTRKALEELRADGVACLCLSIGSSSPGDALNRVFGSASRANAATLADLSPRMDELFLAAPSELGRTESAPRRGSMMRCCLTGCVGNIGSHTGRVGSRKVRGRRLRPSLRGLARTAALDERVHVRWGDITDPAAVRAALHGAAAG